LAGPDRRRRSPASAPAGFRFSIPRDVYRLHKDELNAISDMEKRYDKLVELNVQEQCVNLIKTAAVQQAHKERGLHVHGWVFDIHTGKLIDLNIDFPKILTNIMDIYKLD